MSSDAGTLTFSVVTISFNQAEFLEGAIKSVLSQEGVKIEYIIIDPGSTDGSREIIERYRSQVAHIIYEKDSGPADGLNRGFSKATGDVFCYLNSDDLFEPGAFESAAEALCEMPSVDVICGHAFIVDEQGRHIRKVWSDPFNPSAVAYGSAIQIQPSTFIRRAAYEKSGGFKVDNRSNWDGELLADLHLSGARFGIINKFLSSYRLHTTSITNSGSHDEKIKAWSKRRFSKLMGREYAPYDRFISIVFKIGRQARNPKAFLERLFRGPVYKRGV